MSPAPGLAPTLAAPPLHALLVPLAGDWLVLPNNAVAEVLGRQRLEAGRLPSGAGPAARLATSPGLLGRLGAPFEAVPVVRFEALNTAHGPTTAVPVLRDTDPLPPAPDFLPGPDRPDFSLPGPGPADPGSPDLGRRARLLLIHGLHSATPGRLPTPWALLSQGPPILVSLTAAAVADGPLAPGDNPRWVAGRLRVARYEAVIPHLDRLEAWLAATLA